SRRLHRRDAISWLTHRELLVCSAALRACSPASKSKLLATVAARGLPEVAEDESQVTRGGQFEKMVNRQRHALPKKRTQVGHCATSERCKCRPEQGSNAATCSRGP